MMKIRSTGSRTVLAALLLLAGCLGDSPGPHGNGSVPGGGGGGDDDGGGGGGALTPQAFLGQLITKDCEKAFACRAEFPATEGTFDDEWGTSVSDCVESDDDYASRSEIAAGITAGHIKYDADIAANCLANLAYPASCPAFFADYDWPDSCYDALAGQVADGGSCTTGWDCGPDSDCITAKCAPAPAELTAGSRRGRR
jgi:hypothetical protein